ncbi:tyrosine-type recombinase/integrase [Streptococcus agalactiae]|uniref:tyrosine-type recombinase/integrase n=1 Tax=Streptococcus agalactiae TaxID=1311 RepID=UPI00221E4B98|nr:site-specific integrase [Streptococcus agalactiae]MCW1397184.1 site-specific integrase [Streptococcus agalactiae]MCW1636919.1 site-specific integrase [Streptococcus agalactiae]
MNIKEVIKKNGTKVYRSNVYLGVDSITGKKVKTTVTGRTKKEVKAKAQQTQSNFNANGSTVFKRVEVTTYKELTDLWLENYQMTVKPQTLVNTRQFLRNHILPVFGDMQLDKIHIAHIQSWVNKLAFKIVNYGVAASINKRILQYGVSMQLIPFNPAREVILPRPQKAGANRIKFIDKEDLKTFLDYMERLAPTAYNYYFDSVLYKLLLATGCRYGEAVALEWSDIDFNNATINITKTYNRIVKQVGTPKSKAGIRIISIDNKTILMLKQYRNRQRQLFFETGARAPALVFSTTISKYPNSDARTKSLRQRCKEAGIPQFTFHAFRHTHASLLLNAGIGYKELQHRLGHATLAMTMDTYSHLSKEKEKEAVLYYEKALQNL